MHLALHPVMPWPLVVTCAAGMLALTIWAYVSTLVNQSGHWRWVTFWLRMASLALALVAMLRPSLVFTETQKKSASLLLLYDRSRSMLVSDAWDGLPRWRAMNQTLSRSRDSLDHLRDLLEIREYEFDSKLSERVSENEPPSGNSTALGDVLREAINKAPGRVAAAIMLTDGVNTAGTPPLGVAQSLKDFGVPLFTVGFGQATAVDPSRDLAV